MIVVDTGPLVALVDSDDQHHQRCTRWFDAVEVTDLLIPAPVIAEACYLIAAHCGSRVEVAFLRDLASAEYGEVGAVLPSDLGRMADLVAQYADLPLGGTDACVVAVAERLGCGEIATIDHRHFSVVRPRHIPAFALLPN